jgi:simple sugar transport system permease protein
MMWANDHGLPLFFGLLVALLACALIGLANGLITQLLKLPSFITTLGT